MELVPPVETQQTDKPILLQITAPTKEEVKSPYEELCGHLTSLASYTKELQTQSHLIHLNYEAANFLEVHQFLKDQYEAHLEQFDTLAELVRAMDHLMPMCDCGLRDSLPQNCFQRVSSYDPRQMLTTYYQNLEDLVDMSRKVNCVAEQCGELGVANYLSDLMTVLSKSAWMVKATLRNCASS